VTYRESDALLQTALEDALKIPVRRILYRGDNAHALALYQCTKSEPFYWDDDELRANRHTYDVDIYARTGHVALVRRAYEALRAAGFDGIRELGEDYDDQTQMYHTLMECSYTEDVD
jgi:hypothetical protein